MCRFIAYLGQPLVLADVIYKPENSLISQSRSALEMDHPLNGDGFGLSWYHHGISEEPGLFRSIQPAWNDLNLLQLAAKIRSDCFAAHIRAASMGGVAKPNCHPFVYQNMTFMHNGTINEFDKIKRHVRHRLSDEFYDWIHGETDSEHLCALFLQFLSKEPKPWTVTAAALATRKAIAVIENLQAQYCEKTDARINLLITNGHWMLGLRYVSSQQTPASSLHYSAGNEYEFKKGVCHMHPTQGGRPQAILISSEKLTHYQAEWHDIEPNHFLLVNEQFNLTLEAF